MDMRDELCNQIKCGKDPSNVIKNFYIIRHTHSFLDKYEEAENILTNVANFLDIDISSILITGSAKIGFSLVKNTDFLPGKSDLDLAIVDSRLFTKYFDAVLKATEGYTKRNLFNSDEFYKSYLSCINKGVFHPRYMPNIYEKRRLLSFFSQESSKYRSHFGSISTCFYMSEFSFQNKQVSALNKWINSYQLELIGK